MSSGSGVAGMGAGVLAEASVVYAGKDSLAGFKRFFKGKIVDGVLTTEAKDLNVPWSVTFETNGIHNMRDIRFQLIHRETDERETAFLIGLGDVARLGGPQHHRSAARAEASRAVAVRDT